MGFRKCTSLFLALLLLVSNAGLAINVHFCEGKLSGISSVYTVSEVCAEPKPANTKACCATASTDHKSCCEDKTVDLQDDSDEVIIKTISISAALPFVDNQWKPALSLTPATINNADFAAYYCETHAPPLFKLYSQYIFYA